MKKQLLSLLMALCVGLCLVPAAVLAVGDTKGVSSADELTAAAADSTVNTIRLAADIDISASLTVARKVTLDLNGHTLRYQNAAGSGSVIIVSSGAELTVTDSSAATETPAGNGKISGGTGTNRAMTDIGGGYERLYGGGILIDDDTVNMTAGNITDSKADLGGGVAVMKGSFYMSGGTINNCESDGPIRVTPVCRANKATPVRTAKTA